MENSKDLQSCFKDLITSGEDIYSDISVEFEDEIFYCHRFVLSACSPFFRALFRWDMQEKKRDSIRLEEISSKTFKLIYRFIYYNDNNLNEDNVLDVWKAADFLQIEFIVTACQNFAIETINERNCHRYLWHAKLLGKIVMPKIMEYITNNFDKFRNSECIRELEGEEFLSIVRDSNLMTSREENVVDTIFKWVSPSCKDTRLRRNMLNNASSRSDYLVPLLSLSRLTSLSHDYLTGLLLHQHMLDNVIARDLIMQALMYRLGCRPTYWPTFACHRNCSQWQDVILMRTGMRNIEMFGMTEKEMVGILDTEELPQEAVLNVHSGEPYVCGYSDNKQESLSMFLLVDSQWQNVANHLLSGSINTKECDLKTGQQTLITCSVGDRVYVVHTKNKDIFTWDPLNCNDLSLLTSVPCELPVIHVAPYNFSFFVICGAPNRSAVVNIFNTTNQEWEASILMDGIFDQNIASFQKKEKLYLLTSSGEIYCVDSGVSINHVTSFANFRNSLVGSLVYCEDLYVFFNVSTSDVFHEMCPVPKQFSQLFNQVHMIGTANRYISLSPMCIQKSVID